MSTEERTGTTVATEPGPDEVAAGVSPAAAATDVATASKSKLVWRGFRRHTTVDGRRRRGRHTAVDGQLDVGSRIGRVRQHEQRQLRTLRWPARLFEP